MKYDIVFQHERRNLIFKRVRVCLETKKFQGRLGHVLKVVILLAEDTNVRRLQLDSLSSLNGEI